MTYRVWIRGSEVAIPMDLCVSCSRPPSPGRFIFRRYRWGFFKRDFTFPACESCARLYEAFWPRYSRVVSALTVLLLAGWVSAPLLVTEAFVRLLDALPDHGWRATEAVLHDARVITILLATVALVAGIRLSARISKCLVLRSLGDPTPPPKLVRMRAFWYFRGINPEMWDWAFWFENQTYGERFRSLNESNVVELG